VQPAEAAQTQKAPSKQELAKLQVGYARVQYLLQNWESVTSDCPKVARTASGKSEREMYCDRDPLRVQDFIGYKSMKDPLFKADKVMLRALPLVDGENVDRYEEAVIQYQQRANDAANLAYTSSWGEANPGGGKDKVDMFLEQSKSYVLQLEQSLKIVLECLDLEELPLTVVQI
jgi:hypothetical protein